MDSKHVAAPETARLEGLRRPTIVLVALMAAAAAVYFPWRLWTFNPDALWLSILVYSAELFGLVCIALHVFMTSKITVRTAPPPLDGVTVDLFVTTYDEPVSMLRRTLAAAKQVRRATRIVLLDDGNRPAMRRLAQDMGVDYLARTENTHAKAGNLNHGLEHSKADFVATFDADHAPAPDFLEQTLGYFRAEHVAVVQTPQDFYNLDSFQHRRLKLTNRFWTEQSLFFRVIQPGKDRWNAAFYCGSCAVMRRFALNRIGGFATGTITEDLHTSIKIHKAGFESVYHNVSLAYGVAPASFEPYASQRLRWGQGAMQVWRKEGVLLARGLTLPQRLCYFASIVTYFDAWQKALFFLLPAFVLITGIMPLAQIDLTFLVRFLPWFVLSMLVGEEVGRGYARSWTIEQYNFMRAPAFMRATLALILPTGLSFNVTAKAGSKAKPQSLSALAIVPVLMLAAIAIGVWRFVTAPHLPLDALIINIAWALLLGAVMVSALRFAWSRTSERRVDYRFAAPLPIDVHLPSGGWGAMRALDMTPDGVRLAAPMGLDFSVGQKLEAVLNLPNGRAPITLRVRHRAVVIDDPLPQRLEIGCAFAWRSLEDQDRLNALLFGAGLEQHLLDLNEQGAAPLDIIARDGNKTEPYVVRRAWAPGLVEENGKRIDVAVQPIEDTFRSWRVLSYEPLAQGALMSLPIGNGKTESSAPVRVVSARVVPAGDANVYVSSVALKVRPPAANSNSIEETIVSVGGSAAMLLIVGLCCMATARAATQLIAGAEGGVNSTYAYAGAVVPFSSDDNGNGWAARVTADRVTYSYENGGAKIDGEGRGGEVALVRRWAGDWGWADASVGARYRDTKLSPNDPSNDEQGGHTDVSVQTQGRAHVSDRADVTWLGIRQLDRGDSVARVGVDRDMGGWRLGADATRISGDRYGVNEAGLTAEWKTERNVTLSARAGASRNDEGEGGGYAGLGLSINLH